MTRSYTPKHKAALYFNELAPIQGQGERCALFGHFYHLPEPDAELTRPVVALSDSGWGVVSDRDVNDIACGGVYVEQNGIRKLMAVFRRGETFVYQGVARTLIQKPSDVGFLAGVRLIGDSLYVCGSQNVVCKLNGSVWQDVAGALRVPYQGPDDPILNSIDGFSEFDIYAVGYSGSLVRFDGVVWHNIDSPTNQHLHQVLCHSDGFVYACGKGGVIIKGRFDDWEIISSPDCLDDFWGLAEFNGSVYLSSYRSLFRIVGQDLVEIPMGAHGSGVYYRLASNQSYLWVTTGTGKILRFDKEKWVEFVWPDSV